MSTIISDPLQSVPTTATRWDIAVFKVENTIFRVNRHGFTTASPFFEVMFRLPTGNNCKVQGTTDDDPIVLEGYKAVDFDALLRVLYPTCQDFIANCLPLTRDQWISALRLSTIWEMKEVREFAIKKLSNDAPPLTPAEKVNLSRDHKVASWLVEGLVSLTFADRDFPPEALETLVGLRTAFQIASIRLKKRSSCAKTIPLTIDNGDFTGLSIDDLRYPCCWCPFVKDQVEGRIFRVNRHALVQHSEVFEGMYLLPSTAEGTTDNNPIVLHGYKAADFEALLMILYPSMEDVISGKFTLTKEQWIGVLRVARPWEMHKIREFAIKTLSSTPFVLSPVEKVTLARDHKVASWLVEGLASLTLREAELSPDQLEEAVGLRTAFRIVSIQVAGLTKATVAPITRQGTVYIGLSTSAILCGGCYKPCLGDQFACHSCSKVLDLEGTTAMYTATSLTSGNILYNRDNGFQFGILAQYLYCSSCDNRAITRYTTCKLCSTGVYNYNGSANFQLYACFAEVPQDARSSTETLVRTTFKDEIQEYDL